ncbi:MAG TPA: hypothetical protein VFA43_00430 [Gemmatimonadaceae bacterium]|nr:hypothetical protein [Gemmatimonadaceae bacterium]
MCSLFVFFISQARNHVNRSELTLGKLLQTPDLGEVLYQLGRNAGIGECVHDAEH